MQLKLAPTQAPYFDDSDLLIAADCTAYAYADFHRQFGKNRITLIGCPKLDAVDYSDKLAEILKSNDIRSLTVLRMEVPCCGGIEYAAKAVSYTHLDVYKRQGMYEPPPLLYFLLQVRWLHFQIP